MGKGRAPCCDKSKVKKGPWSPAEDLRLIDFIQKHGFSNWRALPKQAGLLRCGKSCRLRWINYLRPDVKRGNFTPQEELTIINLHNSIGNKWSKIASYLPGRTDNEIKNVWNTHLKKRLTNNAKTTNNSASPSCTSSSITTSDDQKIDKTNPDEGFQEFETSKTNQNPEIPKEIFTHPIEDHNEEKEHSVSDSPTSSYNTTNEALAFSRPGITNPGSYPDKIEIPFECDDIDIWELLDTLDPVQEDKYEQNGDNQGSNHSNYPGQEIECNNWLRFLENELGLTSDPIDIPTNEMDFELEISPMWPCSPQNFSI